MASPVPLLLLLLWTFCLPPTRAGSHSRRYLSSTLSRGLSGTPQFTAVGFVDDEQFSVYSSWSRRLEPRAPWMGRVAESDPRYWERGTDQFRAIEAERKADVRTAMGNLNHTAGLHTFQVMCGCELRDDGSTGGFRQYAYDGHDLLSFDKENMKFTAAMEAATVTADRWNKDESIAQSWKVFLEQECIEYLQNYLNYGKEMLLRTVPPRAMISRRKSDTATTLTCYAFGFYPREIEVKWMRNEVEVDWKTKVILPNTDGTYQIRTTVELPEGHEKEYRCLVDHIGLEDIITKVYNDGARHKYLVVGAIIGVSVLAIVIAAFIRKKNHPDHSDAAEDKGPCSSSSNSSV